MKIHIWQALHDTEARREMEKESLEQMIGQLCPDCLKFRDYAWKRTDKCPFMKTKTFCSRLPERRFFIFSG